MGLVVIRPAAVRNGPRAWYNVLLTCPTVMLSRPLHSKSHQDYLKILCVWASTFFFGEEKNISVYIIALPCHCELTVTRQ